VWFSMVSVCTPLTVFWIVRSLYASVLSKMKHFKTEPAVVQPTMRYAWTVVFMLWLICFFNYADRQAIFSVFPLLQKELSLSSVQLGLLGSAFAWVYGLSGPVAGLIVDRIQRRTAILGGLQFWSIVCALSALAHKFSHLIFFRAAEGLGESLYYPASTSLISDYHAKQSRSRALGVLVTSVYAGTVGGGFWAAYMAERYGWRISFLVLGVLGSVLGIILLRFLREIPRGTADSLPQVQVSSSKARLKEVLSTPTALLLMAVFVCANFVALVLLSWMPAYLYERFHLSIARAALTATLCAQGGSVAGAFTGGWMADKLSARIPGGRLLTQAIGVLIGAPCVALCGYAGTLRGTMILLILWGFGKGIYDANIFASAYDVISPQSRGTTSGLMNCVGWAVGGGTAPLAVGIMASHYGLGAAISASSIAYVVAAVLLIVGAWVTLPRDLIRLRRTSGADTAASLEMDAT